MKDSEKSESYQRTNLKLIISFAKSIGYNLSFHEITSRQQIQAFLDSKIRSIENDPDCKWITTWNDYLSRLKYFFRWLYNYRSHQNGDISDWHTPDFIQIRKKKTKCISPYLETEIWDREEIQKIITKDGTSAVSRGSIGYATGSSNATETITPLRTLTTETTAADASNCKLDSGADGIQQKFDTAKYHLQLKHTMMVLLLDA